MTLPIVVAEDSKEPIYHQIELQIKTLIISGQLEAGTALPSIRALSSDLHCSVITTRRAYQNLEGNGFIETIQGKGTFVKAMESTAKEEIKTDIVYDKFRKVIEESTLMGNSLEDTKKISEQVFRDQKAREEKG